MRVGKGPRCKKQSSPKEEKLPFLNLKELQLHFPYPVEIWIDCFEPKPSVTAADAKRILFLLEPDPIVNTSESALRNHASFDIIFSHDNRVLNSAPNARKFHHGGTWIVPSFYNADRRAMLAKKKFNVSFICGSKRKTHLDKSSGDSLKCYEFEFWRLSVF